MTAYKRIITVAPAQETDLLSHAVFGVKIRRINIGRADEWVIETDDIHERRAVDKVVKLFDTTL